MKKIKFFALGLAALAFAACNKDNDNVSQVETDATVSVVLKTNPSRGEFGVNEGTVTKLTVMVYNGETQEAIQTAENAAGVTAVEKIPCKSGPRTLVVVANHAEALNGKTLTELKATTLKLAEAHQSADELMMTAEPKNIVLKAGENWYGYPTNHDGDNNIEVGNPLEIKRVHARIAFTEVKVAFSTTYNNNYAVELKEVAALVAKAQSFVFNNSDNNLVDNTDDAYFTGFVTNFNAGSTLPNYSPTNYDTQAWLKRTYPTTAPTEEAPLGFYVLENKYGAAPTERPTILCLSGKLTQNGGSDLTPEQLTEAEQAGWCDANAITYYPVLVNYNGNGYTYNAGHVAGNNIVRNHKYDISLKITGPGTNNPEGPIPAETNLNVTCTVAPWVGVTQSAEW